MDTSAEFKEFNGKLYFSADDGTHGWELRVSDGTESGTQLLKDIAPGVDSAYPSNFIEYQSKLYFSANDGKEVWLTDGTESGTVLVKTFYTGAGTPYPGAVGYFKFNDKLYFMADDGSTGHELWVCDGTTVGTMLVKDIRPGVEGSDPGGFKIFENKLFFFASHEAYGYQLWQTEGTAENTRMIATPDPEVNAVVYNVAPFEFNDTLYYVALYDSIIGREIYKLIPGTSTTGIEAVASENTIRLSPNPSNGIVTIASKLPVKSVELFDLAGNRFFSEKMNNTFFQADFSNLSSGIYILRINTASEQTVQKVVIAD